MKIMRDNQLLTRLDPYQKGVYSKSDLQTAFGEPHPAAFSRRINALLEQDVLNRFCRGWYIRPGFDLATLSQRLAPASYISFGTVLARELIIGTNPVRQIIAVKTGPPRLYTHGGYSIENVSTIPDLKFGFTNENGICFADAEKAVLDTMYYHLRGRRYPFDIYSDLSLGKLDKERFFGYLSRYNNPKFVSFVEGMMRSQ